MRPRETLGENLNIESFLGKQWIQFTAPISQGSSGGALLNNEGKLIGLIVAKHKEDENINFAIPVDELSPALNSKSFLSLKEFKNIASFSRTELKGVKTPKNSPLPISFDPHFSYKNLIREGNAAFKNKNYEHAIMFWWAALKRKPDSIVVLNKIAYAFVKLKEYEKAISLYDRAMKIDPNHFMTVFNLGEFAHELYLNGCEECKEYAIKMYMATLNLHPPPEVEKKAIERSLALSNGEDGMKTAIPLE